MLVAIPDVAFEMAWQPAIRASAESRAAARARRWNIGVIPGRTSQRPYDTHAVCPADPFIRAPPIDAEPQFAELQRPEEHGPEGDAAAPEGARDLPAQLGRWQRPPHERGGRLQGADLPEHRRRARHRVPGADAVRAGRAARPQPLRGRARDVRAERG